jgi:acyl transferase domain-containing protein/acyl carrier protein
VHNQENQNSLKGIAVIGMAGSFPGANNVEQFWQNLCNGVESISFFTDEELTASGVEQTLLQNPKYVKSGFVLEDIEMFDATFFGFTPKEAEIMDPQHRFFLQCAWSALENAGYNAETYKGWIGVYAGTTLSDYLVNNIISNPNLYQSVGYFPIISSNYQDFLATKVSYKLNLTGPSINVSTACSTSLVAVHSACQGLLNYECDMSLAGGVAIQVPQKQGYLYQEGGIVSPDGHCRAFDRKAQGSPFGNGVGIVVLKRLEDAVADGDCIYAVIKGSAINNDGSLKVSYTAPSIQGQAKVIAEAQAIAQFKPETITYIETHGTATALGDTIEISALKKAFSETKKTNFCAIGSVKTNVSHLNAAAGVTGLIKTVLALKNQKIPPSLHFQQHNPEIAFTDSPFYVNTTLREWETKGIPRRAGVSSFGIGGTNAHVVLEEAPQLEPSGKSRSWQVLMLSAKTSTALEQATVNLAAYFQQHPDANLADVAYTLQVGRRTFEHRRSVVCRDIADAIVALQDPRRVLTSNQQVSERPVAFMFTGLGTQYVNMAAELYQGELVFREQVDRCCELLKPLLGLDLRDILYQAPENAQQSSNTLNLPQMLGREQQHSNAATEKLNQTSLTQPAIFVIEYAIAQMWISWGIHPTAMIGYSIGEYVAATIAEVLSLEDALTLVARRAQMIQELPSGAMLAVPLSAAEVRPFLNENLSLSAINGAKLCVIAGDTNAVDELASHLSKAGLTCQRLQTSHAFHSYMMEPIAESFTALTKTVKLQPPKIPYVSNVTGTWITAAQATDPSYWTKHLCQTVNFADGVEQLWKKHNPILLEVGAGQTLSSLAQLCLGDRLTDKVILPSLRDAYNQQSDLAFLLNSIGQLWLSGVQLDWSTFYTHERRHRVPLPTYPFERQRYWIEPQKNINLNSEVSTQKLDIADWFYIPAWKQADLPSSFKSRKLSDQKQCWLIFVDSCGVGSQIVEQLERDHQDVIVVQIGEQFSKINEQQYTLNPQNKDDYNALIQDICAFNKIPAFIAHLWNITPEQNISSRLQDFDKIQELGFYSLLFLAQALGEQNLTNSLSICVISNNTQTLLGEEKLCPEKATVFGSCKVIPQEYTNINCRSIDITLPEVDTKQWQRMINQLLLEITTKTSEPTIAYRGNHRWIQYFEKLPIVEQKFATHLREAGVYIITGGLGKLGLTVAEYLAKAVQAKLVLIGLTKLPPKDEWEQWLSSYDDDNPISIKLKKVQALEKLGAEVLTIEANVADLEQMQKMVNQVGDRFGKIHGVIHADDSASGSFIQTKSRETVSTVFEPKIKGTIVLNTVLQDVKPDFLILFSSISAITGGFSQVDYCAASNFLDTFAHDNYSKQSMLTISINWDMWQENNLQDELMANYGTEVLAKLQKFRAQYGINSQEGVQVLDHILSQTFPQVVVSTQNLKYRIEHANDQFVKLLQNLENHAPQSTHQRPNLKTTYVAHSNEVEQRIADIFSDLLGINSVGIYDNFFDLGGNSLIGIQLISRLNQDFQIEISIHSLFKSPYVAELALIIEEMIIRELQELPEDEVQPLVPAIS